MILRILFAVLLFVCTSMQAYADCADLMADLEEIEVNTMKKAAFDIRKVLDGDDLGKIDPILNFIENRFHDEALAIIPSVIPALLMRPDLTKEQLQKIMTWIQQAEHFYLLRAHDDIIEAQRGDRFFKVLMNINQLREPIGLSKLVDLMGDVETAGLKVGEQDIRDWLGLRYQHLNRILLNIEIPRATAWERLKKDLTHAMNPESLMLARYFLTMTRLNFELLLDETLWAFSAFARLPKSGVPKVLGEDDPAPMILNKDAYDRYFDILEERYPSRDEDEEGDEEDEPWAASLTTFTPEPSEAAAPEGDNRDTHDAHQAELLHILVQALAYVGEGLVEDDADATREVQNVLNDWELAGVTLNAPTIIDDETLYGLTPVQAAYYWDRMPEKNAILLAIEERKLPFWMLPPCERVNP